METIAVAHVPPAQEVIERLKNTLHLQTDSDLAAALGVSPQAISKARKQGRVPRRWLETLRQSGAFTLPAPVGGRFKDSLVFVPQVQDRLDAEGNIQPSHALTPCQPLASTLALTLGRPESMFFLEVSGDSMQPILLPGDLALADQSQTQLHGFGLYVVSMEGALFIRQLDLAPGKMILRCLNPRYEAVMADLAAPQPRIIGRVLWACRRLL